MRRFYMIRNVDQTGISGTGKVLEGVVTSSGKCFIEWRGPISSDCIYPSFDNFKKIHLDGHPGCSQIVWLDPEDTKEEGASNANSKSSAECNSQGSGGTAKAPKRSSNGRKVQRQTEQ